MKRLLFPNHLRLLVSLVPKRNFQFHSEQGPKPEQIKAYRDELFGKLSQELPDQIPLPEITNAKVQAKRSQMFVEEKEKQLKEVGRIEKITIEYKGLPKDGLFLMNKNMSTPYHCALHMSDVIAQKSVVAEVNGQLWDMHKPLEGDSKLRLLTMKADNEQLYQVNRIFWRSCSLMLGAVLEKVFKDHIYVELHSFPPPVVRSGSFVYDADIKIPNWKPNSDEIRVFAGEMIKLSRAKLPIERLEVDTDLALSMFSDNRYKKEQIPEIAKTSQNGKTVTLYKIGDFVDISKGPMMSNTSQLGKCSITALHPLTELKDISETLYRLQGVALPEGFHLNHFAYGLIEKRGKALNTTRMNLSIEGEEQFIPPGSVAV